MLAASRSILPPCPSARRVRLPHAPNSAPQGGAQRRARVRPTAASAAPAAASELQWNDIVEYRLPQPLGAATLGVGRVEEVAGDRVILAPLHEEDDVWVEGHGGGLLALPPGAVLRVLESDLSQRQDRDGNPHGEHAHDVYRLLQPLSGGVWRGGGERRSEVMELMEE